MEVPRKFVQGLTLADFILMMLTFVVALMVIALVVCIATEERVTTSKKKPDKYELLRQLKANQSLLDETHRGIMKRRSDLKIAIVSAGHSAELLDHYRQLETNHYCYAKKWGYHVIIDTTDYTLDDPVRKGEGFKHWVKPISILKWLPHFDWIFFTDYDIQFHNWDIPLEHWIEMVSRDLLFIIIIIIYDIYIIYYYFF